MHSERQKTTRLLSLLTAVLCFVAIGVGSQMLKSREGFPLGDFSGVSAEDAREAYEAGGGAEDLIYLLKVLCYQAEVEGSEDAAAEIVRYGTQLLDMAKAETIDLEVLGDADETLLDLLKMIRSYGAK